MDSSSTAKAELTQKINSLIAQGKEFAIVNGAFGDMEDCNGIIEEVITPPEGGTFVKLFGCSYLFKGYPDGYLVEGLATCKAFISYIPRKIVAKSLVLKLALVFLYIFSKKRFWHYIRTYSWVIYDKGVKKIGLKRERYNRPTNALRRAVDIALTELDKKYIIDYKPELLHSNLDIIHKRQFLEAIACLAEFVYLFLEYDNAYRFRVQDVLSEVKKENLNKWFGAFREFNRILKLLIEREDAQHGIRDKWKEMRILCLLFFILERRFRKFIKLFFENLDVKEIALDDADWYFCLKRHSHNARGMSLRDRLELKKKI